MPGWATARRISASPAIPMWCRWAKAGARSLRRRDRGRHALWPRRRRHEIGHRRLRRRGGAHLANRRAERLDQPADHRRRGRRRRQRHRQGAGLAEGAAARRIDHCIVGEPTSRGAGRRHAQDRPARHDQFHASRCTGMQGHVAYPQKAQQSDSRRWPRWSRSWPTHKLDKGSEHFDPSTLAFTTIDVGNPATNVIPGEARAGFNIRFNDQHTPDSLTATGSRTAPQRSPRTSRLRDRRHARRPAACPSSPRRASSPQLISDTVASVTGQAPGLLHQRRHLGCALHQGSSARWWNWACPAPPCTRPTNACRWRRSQPLTDIYAAMLDAYFANPPQ